MDAIFRLTRKDTAVFINVTFSDDAVPVALPRGVMAPFNSQNTLFQYEALWGMYIPISTTFRVCDIWRGYWAQRLVWEVAGNLAFLPASVHQFRNAHDYLADFVDELDLYKDAGRLVAFLEAWTSTETNLFDRIQQLSFDMAVAGFWRPEEVAAIEAWLQDLVAIGYRMPNLRQGPLEATKQAMSVRLPDAPDRPSAYLTYGTNAVVARFGLAQCPDLP